MTALSAEASSFSTAYRQLRDAQKTSKGAPAYSLYINRPLGRVFAAAAFPVGLTPNQITGISALFTFAGIALLAVMPPTWWVGVLIAVLLVIGYALDSADGQLARLRGGGSMAGEWLDHMIDSGKNVALHLAVLVAAFRFFPLPNRAWLLVPIGFTIATVVLFFGMLLNDQLMRVHRAKHDLAAPSKEGLTPLRTLMKIPTDYGVLCLIFVLFGAPLVFFGAYALMGLGAAGYLAVVARKWFYDIVALDDFNREAARRGELAGRL